MANTYSQLYVHYVFAVQNRLCLISDKWKEGLYKYMAGIIEKQDNKLLALNGISDHVHALISMKPDQAPSDLMYSLKRSSSIWINQNRFVRGRFSWQEGFGAFSCGRSQIPLIAGYIENQEKHHQVEPFREEYLKCLLENEIEFDARYIFREI
jgi:putative transposase